MIKFRRKENTLTKASKEL